MALCSFGGLLDTESRPSSVVEAGQSMGYFWKFETNINNFKSGYFLLSVGFLRFNLSKFKLGFNCIYSHFPKCVEQAYE